MNKTLAGTLIAVALGAGCPEEQDCTAIAVSSVDVTVVDEAGAAIADATATYVVDGEDPVACEAIGGSGHFVCGWEVAGTLQIHVEALGFVAQDLEVEVGADECHVITEIVTVELQSLDCTDEALPGVLVDVVDTQGTLISEATVMWGLAEADMAPVPCEPVLGNRFACAEEQSGDIEISVTEAGPYEDYFAVVPVEHDGCHPITVEHEAVLIFLPDR